MILTKSIELDVQQKQYWLVELRVHESDDIRREIIYIHNIRDNHKNVLFGIVSDEKNPQYCWKDVFTMRFLEKIDASL